MKKSRMHIFFIICFIFLTNNLFANIFENIKLNGIKSNKKATLYTADFSDLDFNKSENFENLFIYDNFRIFYTNRGENALIHKNIDNNKNSVPDYIEDIMTELVSSKMLLDSFGFDLFNNKSSLYNYINIKNIDVIVTNKTKNAYFFGYLLNRRYKILDFHNLKQEKSILIRIEQRTKRIKKTVPHELFHAYQQSNTRLNNGWFTEGTAVWFEYALSSGVGSDIRDGKYLLPNTKSSLEDTVLSQTYKANTFWNRLTKLCSSEKEFYIPNNIKKEDNYLFNPKEAIFSDNLLYGVSFMKNFFDNLNQQDDILLSKDGNKRGLNNIWIWNKKQRKSVENNKYIFNALKETIISQCKNYNKNKELNDFVKLLN